MYNTYGSLFKLCISLCVDHNVYDGFSLTFKVYICDKGKIIKYMFKRQNVAYILILNMQLKSVECLL